MYFAHYEYDENGNLVSEWFESDYDGDGIYDETEYYEYDADGNLVYEAINDSSVSYEYDENGNLVSEISNDLSPIMSMTKTE